MPCYSIGTSRSLWLIAIRMKQRIKSLQDEVQKASESKSYSENESHKCPFLSTRASIRTVDRVSPDDGFHTQKRDIWLFFDRPFGVSTTVFSTRFGQVRQLSFLADCSQGTCTGKDLFSSLLSGFVSRGGGRGMFRAVTDGFSDCVRW